MLRRTSFSVPLIVFIMYLLSDEKKKNEPLFPAPCPDLKILWTFEAMSSEFWISFVESPSSFKILLNFSGVWLYIEAEILIEPNGLVGETDK